MGFARVFVLITCIHLVIVCYLMLRVRDRFSHNIHEHQQFSTRSQDVGPPSGVSLEPASTLAPGSPTPSSRSFSPSPASPLRGGRNGRSPLSVGCHLIKRHIRDIYEADRSAPRSSVA